MELNHILTREGKGSKSLHFLEEGTPPKDLASENNTSLVLVKKFINNIA